jgi:hypothetical protein
LPFRPCSLALDHVLVVEVGVTRGEVESAVGAAALFSGQRAGGDEAYEGVRVAPELTQA